MRRFVKLLALNGLVVEANETGGGNDMPLYAANAISRAPLANEIAPGKMCLIHFHFSSLYWDFVSSSTQELLVDVKECLAVHEKGSKYVKAGSFTLDSGGNPTVTCWLKPSGKIKSQGEEKKRKIKSQGEEKKRKIKSQGEEKKRKIKSQGEEKKRILGTYTIDLQTYKTMRNDQIGHAETKEADSEPNVASLPNKLCASFFLRWMAELPLLEEKYKPMIQLN
jgi:hypothetical protein